MIFYKLAGPFFKISNRAVYLPQRYYVVLGNANLKIILHSQLYYQKQFTFEVVKR